jgi:hypothetical protein
VHDAFYGRILHFRRLAESAVTVPLRPRQRLVPARAGWKRAAGADAPGTVTASARR